MSEEDDLAWAKPLVEDAQADIAAGRRATAAERNARLGGRFRIKPRTGIGGRQWKLKSDTAQFQRPVFQ